MTKGLWPRAGDTIFRHGKDPDATTDLRWAPMGSQDGYLGGYKQAAEVLFEAIQKERLVGHPDQIFYPFVFLHRHHIELQLKQIIAAASYHLDGKVDFEKITAARHNLHKLWLWAKRLLLETHPAASALPLNNSERLIVELHKLDQSSTAFRYAIRQDGNKHQLEGIPRTVDLENLQEVLQRLEEFLSTCLGAIEEVMGGQFCL